MTAPWHTAMGERAPVVRRVSRSSTVDNPGSSAQIIIQPGSLEEVLWEGPVPRAACSQRHKHKE
jgi:hypothetical protein